jgi:hypothetical protein
MLAYFCIKKIKADKRVASKNKIKESTVKPLLMTTAEQWPPVYNGQPDPQLFNVDSNL